ncbi:MAG: hypothetical protein F4139_12650 [Gemmatimonadetes bacterium]|nr:hypothetical protein [Gemmatimonadota bacterium]MYB99980.1 hypothetical protein [Gemmatimonadota bacterium]MYH53771.1 hypothetical protein [Gemmatimonadota bacterium]MYK65129.1 hypothetical protein [Gemmatimonadota bacterium]
MYQTCMFCKKPLGANEVVETFPVGRRLAFDAAKGRLWVVCRTCQRWNLTPLEERWEAVETCEKLFRGTRVRTSSENIGLARHPEGLELVRIGKPLRPEFAAWRYGDQFGRRRRRSIVYTTGTFAAVAAGWALMGTAGSLVGLLGANIATYGNVWQWYGRSVRFRPSDGWLRRMSRLNALHTLIRPDSSDAGFLVGVSRGIFRPRETEWFAGEDAQRAINAILPAVNHEGGSLKSVRSAVSEIESHGHPERFVHQAAQRWREYRRGGTFGHLIGMPHRLAFEMALHEEEERRALEGELWRLEQAWREAEEIAAIADDLLLPEGTSGFVDRHRG